MTRIPEVWAKDNAFLGRNTVNYSAFFSPHLFLLTGWLAARTRTDAARLTHVGQWAGRSAATRTATMLMAKETKKARCSPLRKSACAVGKALIPPP